MRSATATVLLSMACSGNPSPVSTSPASPRFVDQNPAPDVAEFQIEAVQSRSELLRGKSTDVWAYRDASHAGSIGSVPGPLLELGQGEHVIVHFQNALPDATTIHWHGLRVPNASDGTPASQVPVPPGGSFDYEFDATDAGLFWFHPHIAGDVQIERGLYAPIVVRSADEPEVAAERVLVLDDVKIESSGELSQTTDALDVMLGRQGNVLLVNGTQKPTYSATARTRERWRLVNVANGRYFNLSLPGHQFRIIGWDGGRVPQSYSTETLLIAPGERYDLLVDLEGAQGDVLSVQTVHYDRGHDIPDQGPLALFRLELGHAREGTLPEYQEPTEGFERLSVADATSTQHLVLSEREEGGEEPTFFINDEHFPDITPLSGSLDDVVIWEVKNDAEMDHPFHLHGMFFQVLDFDGISPEHSGWKDTVNIPMKQTARLAVRYESPGRWMYHCHILEHAERGMMGELEIQAR